MKVQPKVSVIIPVYNTGVYLKQCLDSVIQQSLKDIEIICVDDGSTDNSLEIISEYIQKDNRIRVLHQKNRFAGVARNAGMSVASGEYFVFLDSDDFFEETLLEKQYIQCKKTQAEVCICAADKYDNNSGQFSAAPWMLKEALFLGNPVVAGRDLAEQVFSLTTSAPWNKMFSSEYIVRQGFRFDSTRSANDSYFVWCSILFAEKICCVPEVLVHYRTGMLSNIQSTKEKNALDFCFALTGIRNELKKRNLFSHYERGFVNAALSQCVWNLRTLSKSPDAFFELAKAIREKYIYTFGISCRDDEYFYNLEEYQSLNRTIARVRVPKISIIVPVYNVEQYLENCLKSIIGQTYKDIEIICVNDGSTDSSLSILEKYALIDNRIRIIDEKENNGLLLARKKGVELAKGEYVIFVDSDDLIEPRLCQYIAKVVKSDNSDIIQFGMRVEDYSGDQQKVNNLNKMLNPRNIELTEENILVAAYQERSITTSLLGKVYKTGLVKRAYENLPDIACYVGEDILTFFYLAYFAKKYRGIRTQGYYIYQYGLGVTRSDEMRIEQYEPYCKMAQFVGIIYHSLDCKKYQCIEPCVKSMGIRLFEDCCRILKNRISKEQYAQAEQMFVNYWKKVRIPKTVAIKNLGCAFEQISNQYVKEYTRICAAYSDEYTPSISVIIPVYNCEAYLSTCIDSVLNQQIRNVEIICVNDASPDNSLELLEQYAKNDNRITIINQKNGGASAARNNGLKYARGKYVYFLDSDDYLVPNALNRLLECAEENETDIIFFGATSVFDDDAVKERHKVYEGYYTRKPPFAKVVSGDVMFLRLLSTNSFRCSVPLQFIRRDFLLNTHLAFEEGITHEDELFSSLLLANASRVLCIEDSLYMRRVREGSVMTDKDVEKEFISMFTVCIKLKRNLFDDSELSKTAKEAISIHEKNQFYAVIEAYKKLTDEQKDQIEDKLPEELIEDYKKERPDLERRCSRQKRASLFVRVTRKIWGGIRCYRQHGMRYTLNRLKTKIGKKASKILRKMK